MNRFSESVYRMLHVLRGGVKRSVSTPPLGKKARPAPANTGARPGAAVGQPYAPPPLSATTAREGWNLRSGWGFRRNRKVTGQYRGHNSPLHGAGLIS